MINFYTLKKQGKKVIYLFIFFIIFLKKFRVWIFFKNHAFDPKKKGVIAKIHNKGEETMIMIRTKIKNWEDGGCVYIYVRLFHIEDTWSSKKIKYITRGCLPTRLRLHTRGVVCPLQCLFCSEDEDSAHTLFTCPKSAQCWQQMGLWNEVSNVGNISTTIFEILQQLQPTQHPIFSTLMWSIWKNRNNKVWNDSSDTCQVICDRATTLLLSWRNAQEIKQQGCTRNTPNHVASWTKPSPGRYKCNVDASFSKTLDIVGIGMCIRGAEGASNRMVFTYHWCRYWGGYRTPKSYGMGKGPPSLEHGFRSRLKDGCGQYLREANWCIRF